VVGCRGLVVWCVYVRGTGVERRFGWSGDGYGCIGCEGFKSKMLMCDGAVLIKTVVWFVCMCLIG
jgi:hypothetical protein